MLTVIREGTGLGPAPVLVTATVTAGEMTVGAVAVRTAATTASNRATLRGNAPWEILVVEAGVVVVIGTGTVAMTGTGGDSQVIAVPLPVLLSAFLQQRCIRPLVVCLPADCNCRRQ